MSNGSSRNGMSHPTNSDATTSPPWWQPVVFGAMAGGMGWGIRGQYGHETGAMIAGVLLSLTLVLLFCRGASSLHAARAVAWATVAMGIGGSMTYGQTIGLTQNAPVIGNWAALRWGMLGLAIKGGLWIGFAGLFLGIGLGGKRYRPLELFVLMLALVGAFVLGVFLLNHPFDPENHRLPFIYFSADWRWEPGAELKPRPEVWGGVLLALAVALVYVSLRRKDALARNLCLWGVVGGAIGFPLGQCLQAYHAWNPDVFKQGIWIALDPHMNWWNMMETTFGATMGAVLGLGLWLNSARIAFPAEGEADSLSRPIGWGLLVVHLGLLAGVEFSSMPAMDLVYDMGIVMAVIPIVGIAGYHWWPYVVVFPITLLPIAGKTVLDLVYEAKVISLPVGWLVYFIVPMVFAIVVADWFARRKRASQSGQAFACRALLLCAWLYFLLNYAFFRFPLPWRPWTARTPNGIIFTVCVVGLTILALSKRRAERGRPAQEPGG